MRTSSLEIARTNIIEHLNRLEKRVYRYSELKNIYYSQKESWSLAKSTNFTKFLNYLVDEKILEKIQLPFPHRNETRYIELNVSPYELAFSLKNGSYLSHHTAVYLHRLTDITPENIYVNHEQSRKRSRGSVLSQERIELAFKNYPRKTKNKAKFKDNIIWGLNGMYTGCYGVVDIVEGVSSLRVTNIERTLVDIVVRPMYSGGVSEVLKAYTLAKSRLSTKKLLDTLNDIGYIYPYHQVIGFYLDLVGIEKDLLKPFLDIGLEYDFYLTYRMKKVAYSKKWRIYYPESMVI